MISVGWWLVNCAIADWLQTLRVQGLDYGCCYQERGPMLSRVRTLFHYILSGQNIMQNYSATFLSWFVPVRADNEEILISVHASLSFVTEQIVAGDHNTQWDCLQGQGWGQVAPHCTLHLRLRENLLKLFTSFRVITIRPIIWSIRYQLPLAPPLPLLYSLKGHLKEN